MEVQDVVAGSEVQDVVAGLEVQDVVAGLEVQDVVAGSDIQAVQGTQSFQEGYRVQAVAVQDIQKVHQSIQDLGNVVVDADREMGYYQTVLGVERPGWLPACRLFCDFFLELIMYDHL